MPRARRGDDLPELAEPVWHTVKAVAEDRTQPPETVAPQLPCPPYPELVDGELVAPPRGTLPHRGGPSRECRRHGGHDRPLDSATGGSIAWLLLFQLAQQAEPLINIVSFGWTTAETQLRYTAAAGISTKDSSLPSRSVARSVVRVFASSPTTRLHAYWSTATQRTRRPAFIRCMHFRCMRLHEDLP